MVTCPRAEQIRRLTAERGLTAEQAEIRIDAQSPQEEKARQATVVLDNGGTPAALERQVEAALTALKASHTGR